MLRLSVSTIDRESTSEASAQIAVAQTNTISARRVVISLVSTYLAPVLSALRDEVGRWAYRAGQG